MPAEVTEPVALEKSWGTNRGLERSHAFEVHHASIRAGGYSSQHCHRDKSNAFYVVRGELLVHFYRQRGDQDPCATVRLTAGQKLVCGRGEWHRFEAVTDVELVEWYWTDAVDPSDIERHDQGGMRVQARV
jgi:mannose-6-phosphate isomerase-like protein (cupin superfamily)